MSDLPAPPVVSSELRPEEIVALKRERGTTITVCLPALNEEPTIAPICAAVGSLRQEGIVDELVVVDSGSVDGTVDAARRAGASVHLAPEMLTEVVKGSGGKGGTLWKSLSVLSGDIVVWLDSDTRNFGPDFVTRLIAPLLVDPDLRMTKAFYERPIDLQGETLRTGGARVTELAFRPLAHLLFPELVGFIQPLSGEYAAYREDLLDLPFFTEYGVETGLLIDFSSVYRIESIGQVDLGRRVHRNQDVIALGRMAHQVMQVMTQRAEEWGRVKVGDWPELMSQFVSGAGAAELVTTVVRVRELPPMRSVLGTTGERT